MPAPSAGCWPGTRPVSLGRADLGHSSDTERVRHDGNGFGPVRNQHLASLFENRAPRRDAYSCGVSRIHRITVDPEICHGRPTIRGMRYPVAEILRWLAAGMTTEDLVADYPDLEREDVLAALEYGALAVGGRLPLVG